jgi:hypothetical protein
VSETGDEQEPVGTIAEEAAKLLGALSGWAKEHGDGFGALSDELRAHLATDAPECTWCPVCRVVAALRQTSPEVRAHLTSAATSVAMAVSGLLATEPPRDSRVERIDLDDDSPEDRA